MRFGGAALLALSVLVVGQWGVAAGVTRSPRVGRCAGRAAEQRGRGDVSEIDAREELRAAVGQHWTEPELLRLSDPRAMHRAGGWRRSGGACCAARRARKARAHGHHIIGAGAAAAAH